MVTRVWGHVDGAEVVFSPIGNDVWTCKVPRDLDGEYVVDLYAEDDSGNISYTATILFTVDAKHLTFSVKILNFAAEPISDQYSVNGKVRNFTMNVLRCEVCGGDMYTTH